jgi:RHS repeat-associated protein
MGEDSMSVVKSFYCRDRLATQVRELSSYSLLDHRQGCLAQVNFGQGAGSVLFAADAMRTVIAGSAELSFAKMCYQAYGFSSPQSSIVPGFNGEARDAVTGCYLLGAGYRLYSPVMMRFYSPDSWSPFGEGGLNAYAYLSCDPVNYSDPTGHVKHYKMNVSQPKKRPGKLAVEPLSTPASKSPSLDRSNSSGSNLSGASSPLTSSPVSAGSSKRYSSQASSDSSASTDFHDIWKLDKSKAKYDKELTPAEQAVFDKFQNAINNEGKSPGDAAVMAGDSNYKRLQHTKVNRFQIRLSRGQRVSFEIEGKNVIIREVGGHT